MFLLLENLSFILSIFTLVGDEKRFARLLALLAFSLTFFFTLRKNRKLKDSKRKLLLLGVSIRERVILGYPCLDGADHSSQ